MVQHRPSKSAPISVNEDRESIPVTGSRKAIPVAAMVESIIGCKWSVRLLGLLAEGRTRPSALLRACPGLSAKVMNERLQKMMRFSIARRSVLGEKPPVEVEYTLTPFGLRFMTILREVRRLQDAVDTDAIEADENGDGTASRGDRLRPVPVRPPALRAAGSRQTVRPTKPPTRRD